MSAAGADPTGSWTLGSIAATRASARVAGLDQLVAEAAAPFGRLISRLVTIPGIAERIAQVIVAESPGDMTRFATAARLAAWAGLAPGDNESSGKRKKAAARKGNQHLRTAMTESAWTVSRTATRPAPGSAAWPAGSAAATRRKLDRLPAAYRHGDEGLVEIEPAGAGFYAGPPSFDVSHGELVSTARDYHRFAPMLAE